jgi:prepilin signal peptidase PulO-like enzyme (type II secretory pathway)
MLFFYFALFLFGISIGSFLNTVIYRSFAKKNLLGRSFCDHCKRNLEPKDLIPILSFILLKGKCRYCKKPISWQYPLVEFISGLILPLTIYFLFHFSPLSSQIKEIFFKDIFSQVEFLLFLLFLLSILFSFIVFFVSDIKYMAVPEIPLFASLFCAFFYQIIGKHLFPQNFDPKKTFIFTLGVASLFVFIVFLTKEKGMGKGDIYLASLVSLFLGKEVGIFAVYFSFVLGAIFSLILVFAKKKSFKSKIPFGPFLIISGFLFFFFENFFSAPFFKFLNYFI